MGSLETHKTTNVNGEDKSIDPEFDPRSTHPAKFKYPNEVALSSGTLHDKTTNSKTGGAVVCYIEDYKTQHKEQPNKLYLQAMRPHLVKPILASLEKLQEHAEKSSAAMYVGEILSSICVIEDKLQEDPLLEVFSALYDGLACENNWKNYSTEQYKILYCIVDKLLKGGSINQKNIDKAILNMDKAGIEILPYSSGIIDEIQES